MNNRSEHVHNVVINGDALNIMHSFQESSIDVTVTSPPYNKNTRKGNNGWLVANKGYLDYDDCLPEDEYQGWQIEILNEIFRVTRPGGSLFYNHKIRWVQGNLLHPFSWITRSKWTLRQEIIWDRGIAANMRGWRFWQVDERIYWLYKPINGHLVGKEIESRHAKMSSIWRLKPARRTKEHPAPFPLELPVRAIFSLPGNRPKVVLDPFCGTGTTLVAAKLLGHHYIGIDISSQYVQFARERLHNADSELPIAQREMAKHIINDPFAERKRRGRTSWPYGPNKSINDETRDLPS